MHLLHQKRNQKGQVLLLVVLASVIALTVGLAAVSRSITSSRISTEESNSQKALAAAEAGVEEQIAKTLAQGELTSSQPDFGNNSSFESIADPVDGVEFALKDGSRIDPDTGEDIWLSDYPNFLDPKTVKNLTLYWIASGTCNNDPAIELVVISGTSADPDARKNPIMNRYAKDSCSRGNNFDLASTVNKVIDVNGTNVTFNRSFTIPLISNGYIARVIPLYNGAKVAVTSDDDLPTQGYTIESTGSSGDTVRKVKVYQPFPPLPIEFFPYNLFLP